MRIKLKKLFSKWFLPRWLVLTVDIGISLLAFILTYFLRYNLFLVYADVPVMLMQLLAGSPFFLLSVLIFKQHHSIIRHTSVTDMLTLLKSNLLVSVGFVAISYWGHRFQTSLYIPYSVIVVHFFLSVFLMISFRFILIYLYGFLMKTAKSKVNVLIYGAGDMGSIAANVIMKVKNGKANVVGYIDDNPKLWKSTVNGLKVYSADFAFNKVIFTQNVQEVVLAISSNRIKTEQKLKIVDLCLSKGLKIRELYETSTWLKGRHEESKIRDINIEELLGRNTIDLPMESVSNGIRGKRILVTGGAGSIGSEIVRQLANLAPDTIIIIDQSESAVFEIQNEILARLDHTKLMVFVSDITNAAKMRRIFDRCTPHIVYHAAAYKHVPLMEDHPYEAITNNVGGTKIIADLAVEFQVEKFVMVSSDKAVNPTNIMGATKRICEIYIHALSQRPMMRTEFITTRFGNVLGSNGSVIPIFKKQISKGGPVTVTHKDIIRYFMTIPEACRLVLEAGFIGKGGQIYIFDMGSPVKIYDLAERMIALSGLIPHQDIEIVETGLRPGEKLFEELLNVKEETIPTSNEKIMTAQIRKYNYKLAEMNINDLLAKVEDLDSWNLVIRMKQIVPEYISNNSRFEAIDNISSDFALKAI